MDDVGEFATRGRRLSGGADGVVDGDGHARLLLTDGAAHDAVARGNCGGIQRGGRVFVKRRSRAERIHPIIRIIHRLKSFNKNYLCRSFAEIRSARCGADCMQKILL